MRQIILVVLAGLVQTVIGLLQSPFFGCTTATASPTTRIASLHAKQEPSDAVRRQVLSLGAMSTSALALLGIHPAISNATDWPSPPALDIPYSTVRRYKTIQLANGLCVLLVSDRRAARATAALSIAGAGQFADDDDVAGLAHLMEHMILSSTSRSVLKAQRDLEDWLADNEGASNAFTAYDLVCFHLNCPAPALAEALVRLAGLFEESKVVDVCQNTALLEREIKRVHAELDFSSSSIQAQYLLKSFVDPNHPFSGFSAGSLTTLEKIPKELDIDIGARLIRFFRRRYLPSQAVLVVEGPQDLFALERLAGAFGATLSTAKTERVLLRLEKTYPGGFLQGTRPKQVVLYRKSNEGNDNVEKLSMEWALALDYRDKLSTGRFAPTATQIAFVLAQLLGRRGPGSLYLFLSRRGWIVSGTNGVPRITLPLDVSGLQIIRLDIPLTLEGFVNRSAVVAAVYDILGTFQGRNGLSRALLSQYATIAKLYGYVLAPRPPDAIELAVDAHFYGLNGPAGVASGRWNRFPSPDDRANLDVLLRAANQALATIRDPSNAVIIATAGNKALTSSGLFNEQLPPLSSPRWLTEPVSGARFCFEDMLRLPSRLEEIVLNKLIDEEELQPPVLNPLIPASLRSARVDTDPYVPNANEKVLYPAAFEGSRVLRRSAAPQGAGAWMVLTPLPYQVGLPLPRGPPEPNCRCAFVLQLLSSRPARANVRQAAYGELWKRSFENAVSDLAELGAPAGLAYDMSFNKFGLRLSFLGLSQTLPSYARRFCRRLVDHHFQLLSGPEMLPSSVTSAAVATAERAPGLTQQRRRRIVSNLRRSTAYEAATEGVAFLRSCHGAVCFAQGDLLPREVDSLLAELKDIFGESTNDSSGHSMVATPTIDDLVYKAVWKPRSASPCSAPGVSLVNDACGRVPR